jgi:hypothetical protein
MNKDGSITFVGIAIMLILSSLLIISLKKMDAINKSIRNRSQTYLCFKYLIVETDNYITKMAYLNRAIATLYPLTFTPEAAAAEIAIKTAITSQYITHFSYLKNISKNRYCSFYQATNFVTNIPFLISKRSINQTAKIRRNRWIITVTSKKIKLILRGQYRLKNRFTKKAKLKVKEINKEELLPWKLPFG